MLLLLLLLSPDTVFPAIELSKQRIKASDSSSSLNLDTACWMDSSEYSEVEGSSEFGVW